MHQQLKSTQEQLAALQEQYDKHVMEVQVCVCAHMCAMRLC